MSHHVDVDLRHANVVLQSTGPHLYGGFFFPNLLKFVLVVGFAAKKSMPCLISPMQSDISLISGSLHDVPAFLLLNGI